MRATGIAYVRQGVLAVVEEANGGSIRVLDVSSGSAKLLVQTFILIFSIFVAA